MTPTHTPLPWHLKLRKVPDDGQTLTLKRDFYEVGAVGPGGGVAFVFGPDGANAELIVRAVNSHEALEARVATLTAALTPFANLAEYREIREAMAGCLRPHERQGFLDAMAKARAALGDV